MLNIRGMSIVESLLTGVNGFGQGLDLMADGAHWPSVVLLKKLV
jgi:hypothetical protein